MSSRNTKKDEKEEDHYLAPYNVFCQLTDVYNEFQL